MRVVHGAYAFSVKTEVDEEEEETVVMFAAQERQPYPCVRIVLPSAHGNTAVLHALNYYASCSMPIKLDPGAGTIAMLRTALTFVLDAYPQVTQFELQDETFADVRGAERPLITTRRLLQGLPGWYEEHFGALPQSPVVAQVRLPRVRRRIDAWLAEHPEADDRTWWTPSHVRALTDATHIPPQIYGTMWVIPAAAVRAYGLRYEVRHEQGGGGARMARLMRLGRTYHLMPQLIGRGRFHV